MAAFSEEEQADDRGEHVLVLVQRAAVPAAFFAEHTPCLHLRDGMLGCGPDLAQVRVRYVLNSFCQSWSFQPPVRLNGTMSIPSTPVYPRSATLLLACSSSDFRPEAS